MKFCLEVGELERHLVEFNFDQLFGRSVIKVNQTEVRRSVRLFNEPLRETHTLRVGDQERLEVRIERNASCCSVRNAACFSTTGSIGVTKVFETPPTR